jgi:hypothetical protein
MKDATLYRLFARLVIVFALVGLVVACPGPDDAPDPDEPAEMPFDVGTAGHVQGMVMFEGTPPAPQRLDMASEPECDTYWREQDEESVRELVKVRDGHLANVLVYVREGLEGMTFPTPREAVVIDQVGCIYTPHVRGVMANQTLTFKNSDPVMHNINATPQANRPFNFSQPMQNMETNRTFAQPEVAIPVRCDVHGWMRAYVGVVPHPYHAVSNDGGTFDLSDLPPGEYVVEAWHAELGTQEQTVTVETGETAQVSFTFTEDMLASAVVPMGDPIDPHDHNPLVEYLAGSNGHGAHDHAASGVSRR